MCDCAEESERRRREQLNARHSGAGGAVIGGGAGSGSGAGARGRSGGSADGGIGFFRVCFGGSAFLFSVLALLHKYLDIFGPLLEKYGFRPKTCGGSAKSKYIDPNDPDPDRCDGLRIDPRKRRWPLDDKT